ncbi:MAG TPA: hypothetical protein VII56_09035 [Rhizomicrobium sp.]
MSSSETSTQNILQDLLSALANPSEGRIFALMGPNGAGKTRLLEKLKIELAQKNITCLAYPALRQVTFHAGLETRTALHLPPSTANDDIWGKVKERLISHDHARDGLSADSATGMLIRALLMMRSQRTNLHMEKLLEWQRGGKPGAEPVEEPDPLKIFEQNLQAILGYECEVITNPSHGGIDIVFRYRGNQFNTRNLSDGEKQILMLSAFLIKQDGSRFVFLVDEPELYLNEARAIEIWESLERIFPSAIFLHATHSIVFATRETVDKTYLIGLTGVVEQMDTRQPVPPSVIRSMVGARIQLLRTNKIPIFCEDTLLKLIVEDLFDTKLVEPIALEGKDSVTAAVRGDVGWGKCRSENGRFCGVVDRDAKNDDEVAVLERGGVFCFPYNEAESLLLDPTFAVWMLSLYEKRVSSDEYKKLLIESAVRGVGNTVQLMKEHVCRWSSPILRYQLEPSRDPSTAKIISIDPPEKLREQFESRAKSIFDAIQQGDVDAILRLFKGKALYSGVVALCHDRLGTRLNPNASVHYGILRGRSDFKAVIADVCPLAEFGKRMGGYLYAA